jgi:hypothetical protein
MQEEIGDLEGSKNVLQKEIDKLAALKIRVSV